MTERKLAEEQQRVLLDELNHRVKNTLATVQSIATPDPALLAGADPLPRGLREPAPRPVEDRTICSPVTRGGRRIFDAIVEQELTPYRRESDPRIVLAVRRSGCRRGSRSISGSSSTNASPTPRSTAHSRRRRAASTSRGEVEERDGSLHLRLVWHESHGPHVTEPARFGFGSRLIRRSIEGELDGRLVMSFAAGGLVAELTFPIGEAVAAEPRPPGGLAVAV